MDQAIRDKHDKARGLPGMPEPLNGSGGDAIASDQTSSGGAVDGGGNRGGGRHRIENAQGSRLGGGGESVSDPLSPKDEEVVDEIKAEAQALNDGEVKGSGVEPSAESNVDEQFDASSSANGPGLSSPATSPRHRIDRVAAGREAASGGGECVVCGRSAVASCCAQCEGLDGAPLVMCAIPDEPGGTSCFEQFHSE